MRLRDRVALVTGGSSGIGRGICLELAREGAHIVVADLSEAPKRGKYHDVEAQQPTAQAIVDEGGQAHYVPVDMGDAASVAAMVAAAAGQWGRLDIVVNNAGIHIPGDSQTLGVDDWDRVMAINLRGPYLSTKHAVPHLKQSPAGRIIHIASVHAFAGGGGPVYPPAKAGLVNLTRDSAVELAGDNGDAFDADDNRILTYSAPRDVERQLLHLPSYDPDRQPERVEGIGPHFEVAKEDGWYYRSPRDPCSNPAPLPRHRPTLGFEWIAEGMRTKMFNLWVEQ